MKKNNNICRFCAGNKESVFRILVIFLAVSSVFMVFKTIGEIKSNQYIGQMEMNTMSFSGKGEVLAVADIASFNFSVTEEEETPKDAQNLSAEKINRAVDYLKKQGIEEKDIKTTNYSVYPRYEWRSEEIRCISSPCPSPGNKRVLVGYEASQSVSVKVRNTKKAGDILAGIGEIGVTNVSGLNFSVDDEDKLKREARKLAIEDAKSKAESLAQDLGVDLVRIVKFNESGVYPIMRSSYGEVNMLDKSSDGKITPEIPLGENKITSNITITYEIR